MNALISGFTGSNRRIIFVLDSPFMGEGYRLYKILIHSILKLTRVKRQGTVSIQYMRTQKRASYTAKRIETDEANHKHNCALPLMLNVH